MQEKLLRFIQQARQKGMDPTAIFMLLRSAGWKDREVAAAIAASELGVPIPERAGVGTARDAFFHLLTFTALFAWAISLIHLGFTYVSFAWPDPAALINSYVIESSLSAIRISLATLIVAYPLFVATWWYLLREIRRHPEKAKADIRRWLTSLTLFVAAVTILGDAITVVYYLVDGDLTLRFLLKVLVLLVVAGGIFAYLSLTLRSEAEVRREADVRGEAEVHK